MGYQPCITAVYFYSRCLKPWLQMPIAIKGAVPKDTMFSQASEIYLKLEHEEEPL